MKTYKVLIIIFLSTVYSCMVGPKYQSPDLPTDVSLKEEIADSLVKDSVRAADWIQLFEDSVLIALVDTALHNNLDLEKALARIEEARALYGFNKADLFPSFTYSTEIKRTEFSSNVISLSKDPISQANISGGLSWEVDLWGKLRHQRNAAKSDMKSSEETANAIRLSLIAEVASVYFTLLDLDNRLKITEATIQTREAYFTIINNKFTYGDVPELDKLQSQQQLDIAYVFRYQIIRQIKETERSLSILLGLPPQQIDRGLPLKEQTVKAYIPDSLPSRLVHSRPDLRAFEYKMMAQNNRVGMAVAMRYPSFQLSGMFGFASKDLSVLLSSGSITNSISAGLFGPIYNFGKNKRRVEIEKFRLVQFQKEYERLYLNALMEVGNALTYTGTYKDEMIHRNSQVEAARKTLMLSKARYDNGYTSYLEVLINEQNLLSAELEYSILQRNFLISYLTIYKSFGGGW